MSVNPIPPGHHTVNIHLTFRDSSKALAFYKKAFRAEEHAPTMFGPGGQGVMHAELRIGDTVLMFADDAMSQDDTVESGRGAAVVPHFAVADADVWFDRAVAAGCTPTMPMHDAFWGARYGQVKDPFGLTWGFATQKEALTPDEVTKRAIAAFSQGGG